MAAVLSLALAALLLAVTPAWGQHPPQHQQLHEDFYKGWRRDNGGSCCSNHDCYPTRARFKRGQWFALRREDQKWVHVPPKKIISHVSPDGRAHLCSYAPSEHNPDPVPLCFVPPSGGA